MTSTESVNDRGATYANTVVFDMDGVLVDSERYWGRVASEEILPSVLRSDSLSGETLAGMNVAEQYEYLDGNYEVAVTKSEYVALYDEYAEKLYGEQVALLPDFELLAGELRSHGVSIALASSAPRNWIHLVLDRFGLDDVFEVVLSVEDIEGAGKPSPDIYLAVADRLDRTPSECVAVEDSDHGLRAANAAGMTCVAFEPDAGSRSVPGVADAVTTGADELATTLRQKCGIERSQGLDNDSQERNRQQ